MAKRSISAPLAVRLFPFYVLVAGLFVWFAWDAQHRTSTQLAAAQQQITMQTDQPIQGRPVRLVIPHLDIDVPMVSSRDVVAEKSWSAACDLKNNATIASSPVSNQSGVTLLYGQDLNDALRDTRELKEKNAVQVHALTGHIFTYYFEGEEVVDQTDTQIFAEPKSKPGIKMMICGATAAQNRVMSFSLQRVL
jgi:hypothetical protein